jgi:xanthine dehydrogenase accessory factor
MAVVHNLKAATAMGFPGIQDSEGATVHTYGWNRNAKEKAMRKLFQTLHNCMRNGEDTVLATIIASSGSTPRSEGASMLVTQKERVIGTIGGGAIEHEAECVGMELVKQKASKCQHFYLRPNQIQDLGMICGGDVEVKFQFISAQDAVWRCMVERIEDCFAKGMEFWMILRSDATEDIQMAIATRHEVIAGANIGNGVCQHLTEKPGQFTYEGESYYAEMLQNTSRVYIFGGGHVSQALVPALAAVNFRCVILEDREAFCKKELFPQAADVKLIDNQRVADFVQIGEQDYVCIMTRGHKDDMIVQAQVLKTAAKYIGVIGSRSKKAGVFAKLRDMGITDEELSRVTTPIGLSIGAETPAEIAVSIAAQLIEVRAGKK